MLVFAQTLVHPVSFPDMFISKMKETWQTKICLPGLFSGNGFLAFFFLVSTLNGSKSRHLKQENLTEYEYNFFPGLIEL